MARPRKLAKPPITEALVDIRVTGKVGPEAFEPLTAQLRDRYPIVEPHEKGEATFRFEAGKFSADARGLGLQGYFLRSAQKDRLAQFRVDGFTFNVLGGYSSADDMLAEALPLWGLYREAARPQAVVRVAMRYINTLSLPWAEGDDFARFLRAGPSVPGELPQQVSEFLTRFAVHFAESKVVGIVTQRMGFPEEPGTTRVVIDVDVFREVDLEPSADLDAVFAELRRNKNDIFFSLITEDAVELFQ